MHLKWGFKGSIHVIRYNWIHANKAYNICTIIITTFLTINIYLFTFIHRITKNYVYYFVTRNKKFRLEEYLHQLTTEMSLNFLYSSSINLLLGSMIKYWMGDQILKILSYTCIYYIECFFFRKIYFFQKEWFFYRKI